MDSRKVVAYSTDSIQRTADIMAKTGRDLVVILLEPSDPIVVGVVTNHDIVNKAVAKKKDLNVPINSIMTKKVIAVTSDHDTTDAVTLMLRHGIKRVVIMDGPQLKGVLLSEHIMKIMLKHKKLLLDLALEL